MFETDVPMVLRAGVLAAIRKYEKEIRNSVKAHIDRLKENRGINIDRALCALWLASDLFDGSGLTPVLSIGSNGRSSDVFDPEDVTARSALSKAVLCAQAGFDSSVMTQKRLHLLATVSRPSTVRGGAIIRRIGRIEVVVSTAGLALWDLEEGVSADAFKSVDTYATKYLDQVPDRSFEPHEGMGRRETVKTAASTPIEYGDAGVE